MCPKASALRLGSERRAPWPRTGGRADPPYRLSAQVAALLHGAGGDAAAVGAAGRRVLAFDKSPDRLELLRSRMVEAGADTIVSSSLRDWLKTDPADPEFASVRAASALAGTHTPLRGCEAHRCLTCCRPRARAGDA